VAELRLFNLDYSEFMVPHRRAKDGDEAAGGYFAGLWDSVETACAYCNEPCGEQPFCQILPEYNEDGRTKVLACLLCEKCRCLSEMQRLGRA
jgi:hypothetical protein